MAEYTTDALDNIYFFELLRSSIIDLSAEDRIRFATSLQLNGTLRYAVDEYIEFEDSVNNNIKTFTGYDYLEFSEALENHGTLRWTGAETIQFTEDHLLGKELNLFLSDTLHLAEVGNRAYFAETDDAFTITDSGLKVLWDDVIDSLSIDDEAVGANRPDRTDNLAFSEVVKANSVRRRPITDSVAFTDVASAWLNDLTKEYQPI